MTARRSRRRGYHLEQISCPVDPIGQLSARPAQPMVAGRELCSARDRARQEAEAERRAGDETGIPAAHLFEQAAGYGAHIHHVEIGLDDRHVARPHRLEGPSGSLRRGTPPPELYPGTPATAR